VKFHSCKAAAALFMVASGGPIVTSVTALVNPPVFSQVLTNSNP